MNSYNMTEQEQWQQVKAWLKKYATSIILGVLIATALTYGWRTWQQRQAGQAEQASLLYEQMLVSQMNHQATQLTQLSRALMGNYRNTPYAALAGLLTANQAIQQGDLKQAQAQLQWVIKYASTNVLKNIATLRSARIFVAQNQPQDALNLLNNFSDKGFFPEMNIIKGDAYVALGQKDNAKNAYQAALSGLSDNAMIRPLINMKLNELL